MNDASAPSPMQGRLLIASAAILWSLGGVVAKGMTPLDGVTIAFYRSLFGGLALLPFIAVRKWTFRPVMLPISIIFGIMVGLYLCSIQLTTAANAIFLQYSCVFWTVPIAAIFLRERPNRQALLAIGVATVGIATIGIFGRKGTSGEGLGIAYGLASGIGYASVIVTFRANRDVDAGWLSAVCNLGGAATLGIYATVATSGLMRPTPIQFPILAAFGLIQMALPYLLFAKGLQSVSAAEAGLLSLLEPILTPVWVAIAHGERPATFTYIGGAILIAGVAIRYAPWESRRVGSDAGGVANPP